MLKKIIVIGSGNSGSGAVYDYLCSLKQNLPFLHGKEFRLNHDPDGLSDLYINNYTNFSINNSASAFERFKKNTIIFSKKYDKPELNLAFDTFIKNITKVEYNAFPEFYKNRTIFKNKSKFYFDRIILKKKIKDLKLLKMKLPVNEKKFIKESHNLINKLIRILHPNFKKYKNIILNQSANYWNFELSSKFFDKNKIIIVDRDPRSIFWSMKRTEAFAYPGHNVDIFIRWFEEIQKIYENKIKLKKNILKVNYEKFLTDYDIEREKINKFVGCKYEKIYRFNIENSKKNLYKASKYLKKKDLRKIEARLRKYLRW